MINLARHKIDEADPEVNKQVFKELTEAGIEIYQNKLFINTSGEVPTDIIGTFDKWGFRRSWYYWVATGPGIPMEIAREFNRKWRQEVRIEGSAGGQSSTYNNGFAIGYYHIDSQEGLNAFVELLKSIYIEHDDKAD